MRIPEVRPYWEVLNRKRGQILLKRVFDLTAGLILSVILAVPMAVISVLIKRDSEGPVPVVFAVISLSVYVIWKRKEALSGNFWRVQTAVCLLSLIKPLIRISVMPCFAYFGSFALSIMVP